MALQDIPSPAGFDSDVINKVGLTHDKMIDLIVANPRAKQDDIAALMGYTPGWVSRVVNSDSFKLRLASRRAELVDPLILASLKERFEALAMRGMEVMQQKLDQPADVVAFKDAAQAVEIGAKGLAVGGFGQKVSVDVNASIDLRAAIEEGNRRRQELRAQVVVAAPVVREVEGRSEEREVGFDLDTEVLCA